MNEVIDSINGSTMRKPKIVDYYANVAGLGRQERAAVDSIANAIRDQPLLDIGVGGGRTTAALLDISRDYLGVDYSADMIAASRRRFPGVRFEHMDARNMSKIPDASIAAAMFAWCGICMVSHEDRLKVLSEVFRILRPGGYFLFSTYNMASWEHTAGFRFPELQWTWNPAKLGVRLLRLPFATMRRIANRRRFLPLEVRTPEYSIINDVSHDYATMLYYISLESQRRQLANAGFQRDAVAFDVNGRTIVGGSEDAAILFVARK
jgi:ubiquinone/menaquinone biosynthesis C-methylase UbiE